MSGPIDGRIWHLLFEARPNLQPGKVQEIWQVSCTLTQRVGISPPPRQPALQELQVSERVEGYRAAGGKGVPKIKRAGR